MYSISSTDIHSTQAQVIAGPRCWPFGQGRDVHLHTAGAGLALHNVVLVRVDVLVVAACQTTTRWTLP